MCSVETPEPLEIERPTFVRNPFLDELREDATGADASRRGRSSLTIPTDTGIGFDGRGGTSGVADAGNPNGNSRNPGGRRGNQTSGPLGIPAPVGVNTGNDRGIRIRSVGEK